MDCVDCECTVKTMNNLENAIRGLLKSGKNVNKMMDEEKAIREENRGLPKQKSFKMAAVKEENENTLDNISEDPTMVDSKRDKKHKLFNKKLGAAETIDFEIPSLTYESSPAPYTSASLSIPKKTCSMYSKRTTVTTSTTCSTTRTKQGQGQGQLVLDEHYVVDRDGRSEILPLKVAVKQNRDGSLNVHYTFLDQNGEKVMNISLNVQDEKVTNVQFEGREVQPKD